MSTPDSCDKCGQDLIGVTARKNHARASSGNSDLLYAERDIQALDELGNYYCKHVSAMTAEGLHSKSDIAAELGYRDKVIDELKAALKTYGWHKHDCNRHCGCTCSCGFESI